jgi:hypothetical protein
MDTPIPVQQPEPSSLTDRLTDVISAPSEIYEEVKQSPVRTSNWLVPWILSCVVTVIYLAVAFEQPPIIRAMQEQRQKAFQKQVATGKKTQAQADQEAAAIERIMTPAIVTGLAAGGTILASAIALFLLAVAIWLALKWFTGADPSYMKVVEVCGLALVIDVPQKILRLLLVLWKQNLLVTVSPTLFISNPETSNRTHVFLSIFDLVDFWWLAVLSLGVSKIASVSYRTAATIVIAIWLGFRVIAMLLTPSQS